MLTFQRKVLNSCLNNDFNTNLIIRHQWSHTSPTLPISITRSKWKVCCASTMFLQLIGTKYVTISVTLFCSDWCTHEYLPSYIIYAEKRTFLVTLIWIGNCSCNWLAPIVWQKVKKFGWVKCTKYETKARQTDGWTEGRIDELMDISPLCRACPGGVYKLNLFKHTNNILSIDSTEHRY
jgi:hypothetical protein